MTDSEVSTRIVRRVRALIDQEFPGSTMNFDPLGLGHISGFGIKHNGGLTLVWVDRTAEPWWLMVDGCVTAGIQDVNLPLEWANRKNRNILLGKFYCNINRTQNIAAIFYEFNFLGPLLEAIFEDTAPHGSASLVPWVVGSISKVVQITAREGEELSRLHGAKRSEELTKLAEDYLTLLFMMLSE